MTTEISLYCWILGLDNINARAFSVTISTLKYVDDLKQAIKNEKKITLNHIDAPYLDIWKLSVPLDIDDDDDGIPAINRLVDNFRKDARSVAEKLHFAAPLSHYFNQSNVPASCLHILVEPPIPGACTSVLGKRTYDALVEFHEKIWNNPDAYNDVFSTRQVKRDGTLTDVDIPSQCCVMHPPFVYSSKYITGIFIRNEYVQAIKDIVAFWIGEKFAPNADNTEESNDEADMVMCSGDVGLYGDMAMETSVRGAAPSAPTPFPSAIDNPFLSTKFPPGPLRCGVIVTGSPGIGKSVLLDVILHLRNLAGCETILVQDEDCGYFFTATGVSRMSRDEITDCEPSRSVWVLVDSDRDLTDVPEWVTRLGCFMVQAASPRPVHLEWEKKEIQVSRYFLKPWSLEEALAARMLQREATPSEAELKAFFERYIPSARPAYAYASTIQQYNNRLAEELSNLSVADVIGAASRGLRIDDTLPHHIFVILPGEDRSKYVIKFASRYFLREFASRYDLRTLVANIKEEKVVDVANELYQAFSRNPKTRGAACQLLDCVVCDIFARSDVWTIREMEISPWQGAKNRHWKIKPSSTAVDKYLIVGHPDHPPVLISDERPPTDVVLQRIETHRLPPTGRITLRTGYWVPTSVTEATFDTFYYEANEKQATVLQLAVSNKHSMKIEGLKRLRDLGVESVCYVAVVSGPQETFDLSIPHEYSNFLNEKYLLTVNSLT